jgi:ABC-type nickel/cobalt efflux system permease component RcnA
MAHRKPLLHALIGLLMAFGIALLNPITVVAHSLDAYLQATYITIMPKQITVELAISPGVLLATEVLPQLDPNGDEQISDAEARAYVDAVMRQITLQVDDHVLTLTIDKIEAPPYLNLQAGYGTIRIVTTATLPDNANAIGAHQLFYRNNFSPAGALYQVNALVNAESAITLGKQNRDDAQQSMTMDFAIANTNTNASASVSVSVSVNAASTVAITGTNINVSTHTQRLLNYLYAPTLAPWGLAVALVVATFVGGLHALTPGHGKTLVAAYLVGSRGTMRHAMLLGGVTTFTHTISVIVVGVLALTAQQFIASEVLLPILEVGSGGLVVVMGVRLVVACWHALRVGSTTSTMHDHGFGPHSHTTGDLSHAHTRAHTRSGATHSGMLTMGVLGGLIPCPEALGIMLIAVGLNRAGLGLALVGAFSLGLAAVLVSLGMLMVRSKRVLDHSGKFIVRWQRMLSLGSALVVTAIGVGLVLKGVGVTL